MKNDLQVLSKMFEGNEVRMMMIDEEIWFVAKDVCKVLELKNPTMAVSKLDDDERAKLNLGRQGEANVVNEYGLYNLVLGSRKKEAKSFKRWVTHEVIPSIREAGKFNTAENEISKIEDDNERELSLKVYQLEEVVKTNPNDLITTLAYNNAKSELSDYKTQRELNNQRKRLDVVEQNQSKTTDYLTKISDRNYVNNKIEELARLEFNRKVGEARAFCYRQFELKHGKNLAKRLRTLHEEINEKRELEGKKPYAKNTLKQKYNKLDIIEHELHMLKEFSELVIGLIMDYENEVIA